MEIPVLVGKPMVLANVFTHIKQRTWFEGHTYFFESFTSQRVSQGLAMELPATREDIEITLAVTHRNGQQAAITHDDCASGSPNG